MTRQEERSTAVVVNDDSIQLAILAGILDRAGMEARAFESAEAALAAMDSADPPHLVVTDLHMPGIDGWRFCRLLRSPEYTAFNEVPILVVSATFAGDHAESLAADVGADAFLPMPIDGKEFVDRVRALLEGKEGRRLPRVLIVESDMTHAGLLEETFAAHGYRPDTAPTAREAGEAFAGTAYDAAVLAHVLPDGTGDALLDAFRAQRPDCACLMMTTDPMPEVALDWMRRGAAAHLHKPFEPEYLIELCARARRERALLRGRDLLEERTRALRESEEWYRTLFNESAEGIYVHDLEGRVLDVNKMASAQSGYSWEEWLDLTVFDGHPCKNATNLPRGEMLQAWSQWAPGQRFAYEAEHQRKDGTVYPVEISAGMIGYGDARVILAFVRDITERKGRERHLRIERDLAQALTTATDLDETLAICLEAAVVASDLDAGGVYLVDPETGAMDLQCHRGLSDASVDVTRHFGPDSPQTRLVREGRVLYTRHREVATPMNGVRIAEAIKAMAVIPLRHDDQVIGCLNMASRTHDEVPEHNRAALEALAGRMGQAIAMHRARKALREREERYRSLIISSNDAIYLLHNNRFELVNPRFEALFGVTADQVRAPDFDFMSLVAPGSRPAIQARQAQVAAGQAPPQRYEFTGQNLDEEEIEFEATVSYVAYRDGWATQGILRDITDRKRAEEERDRLQAQLTQAQRMESVGRLAGGVAHDFNNMLSVILGHTEMAMDRVGPDETLHADLEEIRRAAKRSADLTGQLLAFARKQIVAPKVLDLNATVTGMLTMLRRLIGEDIDMAWKPGRDLWPVRMDPAQVDQILVNLCVNSRDAIPGVGKVTIETDNVTLDEEYCGRHAGFVPGEYVLLAVSDDGCGMDEETLALIFEPFFTTKGPSKGTGLGLATVHGAVKQNNGYVNVYSEPGQGTTFRIYLPRHTAEAPLAADQVPAETAARGSETILLVEDEQEILEITARMLERLGYAVLAARTPGEAIRLAREHPGRIDLLMTDVVMPEMNGRDLAKNLLSICPNINWLFMSGYTANVIAHRGVLDEGVHFLQKPFSKKQLAAKVREALA